MGKQLVKASDIVGGRYKITGPFLGEGSFSEVYPAEDLHESSCQVAVKIEKNHSERAVLLSELRALEGLQNIPFVCKFLSHGSHKCRDKTDHLFIAMERVGSTLAELRKARESKRFTWETTRAVGVHMLNALQALHSRGYIHRDVKPANFTVGFGAETNRILIIDFGLARKFISDSDSTAHLPQRATAQFRGSSKYASIYTHDNKDQGRRDDVWSLFYVLVEFLDGELPWTEEARSGDKASVLRMKHHHLDHTATLCKNVALPTEVAELCSYIKTLEYADAPDYDRIRAILLSGVRGADPRSPAFEWEELLPPHPVPPAPVPAIPPAPWYQDQAHAASSFGGQQGNREAELPGQLKRARSAEQPSTHQLFSEEMTRRDIECLSAPARLTLQHLLHLPPNEAAGVISSALRAIAASHHGQLPPFLADMAELIVRQSARDAQRG